MNNYFVFLPSSFKNNWRTVSILSSFYSDGTPVWKNGEGGNYFKTIKEAKDCATKVNKYFADYEQKFGGEKEKVEIGDLRKLDKSLKFEESFTLDTNNIPDEDRDVEIIYRFGGKSGVCTNFLRQELLKGNMVINPELARWYYIEDSIFLQCKKAGLHN